MTLGAAEELSVTYIEAGKKHVETIAVNKHLTVARRFIYSANMFNTYKQASGSACTVNRSR